MQYEQNSLGHHFFKSQRRSFSDSGRFKKPTNREIGDESYDTGVSYYFVLVFHFVEIKRSN